MRATTLSHLNDAALLAALTDLVARERGATAKLLIHLGEVDARRLYAPAGYASMHAFCVDAHRLSDDSAYKRIQAARAGRKFPALLLALADGRLHLTAICRLAPHLTPENAAELIAAATHRRTVEIDALLAHRFPAMEALVEARAPRALPCPTEPQLTPDESRLVSKPVEMSCEADPASQPGADACVPSIALAKSALPPSPERFGLTIGRATYDRLRHAQALLSHAVPSGNVTEVLDRALDLLIDRLERRRFGARGSAERTTTARARVGAGQPLATNAESPAATGSSNARPEARRRRAIPASIRRAVRERDGGRCTFVGASGRRCDERWLLQFDHVEPVARGGRSTIEGLRLRCAEHNRLEAERVLGRSFMEHKVAVAQAARRETTARFVTVEAAESSPRDTAFDDVVRALRSLGMGDREARRAAACAGTIGDPLEERIRCALRASAPRSFRGTGPPPSRTAPPSGGHAVIAAPSG